VVEDPGGQADRRILDWVKSLRAARHLFGVTKAVLIREIELVPRALLIG